MLQIKDIKGRLVEPMDKILISNKGHIFETIVLYFTNSKGMVVSTGTPIEKRIKNKKDLGVVKTSKRKLRHTPLNSFTYDYSCYTDVTKQDRKHYVYKHIPDSIYILEKNCDLPENLRKLINK